MTINSISDREREPESTGQVRVRLRRLSIGLLSCCRPMRWRMR